VPLPVEDQIMILFAGSQGHLDDVPVEALKKFEAEFISFIKDRKADIRNELRDKKAIDDTLKEKLNVALAEFKKSFVA